MRIVSFGWVRNECDIIEAFVRHHAGVIDAFTFVCHRCRDNTVEILQGLRDEGLPVRLIIEERAAYLQQSSLTALLQEHAADADWILPLDADEFLVSTHSQPLREAVAAHPRDAVSLIPWRTYVPLPSDDAAQTDPLRRIRHRKTAENPGFSKVLIPGVIARQAGISIDMGSHLVRRADGQPPAHTPSTALALAHVPVRGEAQMRVKITGGWMSMLASPQRRPRQCAQWRALFDRAQDAQPVTPQELTDMALHYASDSPDAALIEDPVSPASVHRFVPKPADHSAVFGEERGALLHTMARTLQPSENPVTVVTTADEGYALALAAMVRSMLDTYNDARPLELIILDAGLTAGQRRRLLDSWLDARIAVRFIPADLSAVSHLKTNAHIRTPTYLRLLIPRLLADRQKALYIDADTLVFSDIAALWDTLLDGCPLGAVRELISPTVSSTHGLLNYRELGLAADTPLFNGGVLLMDLAVWRREDIAGQVIRYVDTHPQFIRYCDQDGLNAILTGRWKRLDDAWNVGAIETYYASRKDRPFDEATFRRLADRPRILHFHTGDKPWKRGCIHPKRDLFFAAVDRTAWPGWRPLANVPPLKARIERAVRRALGIEKKRAAALH